MNGRILIGGAIAVALASLAAVGGSGPPQVEVTDLAPAPRATQPVYDARLSPASAAPEKEVRHPTRDPTVENANSVTHDSCTIRGTSPVPVSVASDVVFNGRAFQYQEDPLQVDIGDRVRLFVVSAGPSFTSDFHIVGTVFDKVYADGNPAHALSGVQTYAVPAGGGAVFETRFEKDASGEGVYAFVTHAFADAAKGAVGLIRVGAPQVAAMAH